jgi:hypothetical protein
MSRQRGYITAESRRLRNDISLFQASDSEIQSDLKKLKYIKKPEPELPPVVIKAELPKKRKAPAEDDKFVIDMLLKLQTLETAEVKKKPVKVVEKKPEPVVNKQTFYPPQWMNYMAMQSQLRSLFFTTPFQMYQTINHTSSADKHLRIAKFIQDHKSKIRPNCFK